MSDAEHVFDFLALMGRTVKSPGGIIRHPNGVPNIVLDNDWRLILRDFKISEGMELDELEGRTIQRVNCIRGTVHLEFSFDFGFTGGLFIRDGGLTTDFRHFPIERDKENPEVAMRRDPFELPAEEKKGKKLDCQG